jgi:leucyl aminopeptidase (aminopeptidase T)
MKTLEQLQQEQAEMIATAIDLGLELPADLMVDFDVSTVGERITKDIDKLIKQFRAGLDQGGSEKALASPPEKAQKAPAKKAASKKSTKAAPAVTDPPRAEGDTTVAKPAKKATKAAKKPAKKAAKKVTKKAATGEARAPRSKFAGDQVVTWIAKENPCRKDTARWERYEKLRKASGKTVEKVLAAGVPSATLINASAAKVITIK